MTSEDEEIGDLADLPDAGDNLDADMVASEGVTGARKKRRRRKVTSEDLEEFFTSHGYTFARNELTGSVYINGRLLEDADRAIWRNYLRDGGMGHSLQHADDVMLAQARMHAFNPVKDWIERVPWDGADHIAKMAKYFTDPDKIFPLLLRKWLVGAVARLYEPGLQNRMWVLVGRQGLGKSHMAKVLARGLDTRYVAEESIRPDNKDSVIALTSVFIWEVSELLATTRRADVEALKAFITKARANVRRPFERYAIDAPTISSFIGTANNTHTGFLADPTGERRYMVCELTGIDWTYASAVDIAQLWAQAKAAFDRGERGTFTPDELQRVELVKEHFIAVTVGQDVLDRMLVLAEGGFAATSDIVAAMKAKELSGNDNQLAKDVADYMTRRISAGDKITKVRRREKRQNGTTYQLWGWEGVTLV